MYSKWITNKDLLYSIWNSTQCFVPVWMGGMFGEYVSLSPFAFHLKPSRHCERARCACELHRFSRALVRLYIVLRLLRTVVHQSPQTMGFFRQEYWSGLPCPPPRDLPNLGSNPHLLGHPALQAVSSPLSHRESPLISYTQIQHKNLKKINNNTNK